MNLFAVRFALFYSDTCRACQKFSGAADAAHSGAQASPSWFLLAFAGALFILVKIERKNEKEQKKR
jgi:hypothetical protein